MNKQQVFDAIVKAINDVERMSGQTLSKVRLKDIPINDLYGFDSLRGLEVTVALSIELEITIDDKINLFVSQDGRRAASMEEIVDKVHSLIQE